MKAESGKAGQYSYLCHFFLPPGRRVSLSAFHDHGSFPRPIVLS
jgi:hypothetical protein